LPVVSWGQHLALPEACEIVMRFPFAASAATCDKESMRLKRFANFWIMLCVAAGLLLAPLAAPVMAKVALNAAVVEMQGMGGDMPCCPDEAPGPTKDRNCASCPFVALCMLSVPLPSPSGATLLKRDVMRAGFFASNDLLIDGLSFKPPDHPPRTHV
jgi:hypothetical protein